MKKKLEKVLKALKKRANSAVKKLKGMKISLSRRQKIGAAGLALLLAAAGGFGASQSIKAAGFKDGCVDGAALGLTSVLGVLVGDQFIVNKEKLFGETCGNLSQAYKKGNRVGDGSEAGEGK